MHNTVISKNICASDLLEVRCPRCNKLVVTLCPDIHPEYKSYQRRKNATKISNFVMLQHPHVLTNFVYDYYTLFASQKSHEYKGNYQDNCLANLCISNNPQKILKNIFLSIHTVCVSSIINNVSKSEIETWLDTLSFNDLVTLLEKYISVVPINHPQFVFEGGPYYLTILGIEEDGYHNNTLIKCYPWLLASMCGADPKWDRTGMWAAYPPTSSFCDKNIDNLGRMTKGHYSGGVRNEAKLHFINTDIVNHFDRYWLSLGSSTCAINLPTSCAAYSDPIVCTPMNNQSLYVVVNCNASSFTDSLSNKQNPFSTFVNVPSRFWQIQPSQIDYKATNQSANYSYSVYPRETSL